MCVCHLHCKYFDCYNYYFLLRALFHSSFDAFLALNYCRQSLSVISTFSLMSVFTLNELLKLQHFDAIFTTFWCSLYYFLMLSGKKNDAVFTTFCCKKGREKLQFLLLFVAKKEEKKCFFSALKKIFKKIFNMIYKIDLQRKKNLQKKSPKTNIFKKDLQRKKSSKKDLQIKSLQKRSSTKKSSKPDLQKVWDSNPHMLVSHFWSSTP